MQPPAASLLASPEANCPAPVENWMIPSEPDSANPFMAAFSVMIEVTLMAG
jgi:hypothetical protein